MLFWQLPLLSVILADPHQAVLTRTRQKRAVFDVLPTFRKIRSKSDDKTSKTGLFEDKVYPRLESEVGHGGRHVLKRMAALLERRKIAGERKAIKNILRRMVFEQALEKKSQRQEKHGLNEASVNVKQIPEKATKEKDSLVKDLILGSLNVLQLFLRIG